MAMLRRLCAVALDDVVGLGGDHLGHNQSDAALDDVLECGPLEQADLTADGALFVALYDGVASTEELFMGMVVQLNMQWFHRRLPLCLIHCGSNGRFN